MTPLPSWLSNNLFIKADLENPDDYNSKYEVQPLNNSETNCITSKNEKTGKHKVLLDLDVEHHYVPSSTPGHGHLYINLDLDVNEYAVLLFVLKKYGIIQGGYWNQVMTRGFNSLRLPWIKKKEVNIEA